MIVDETLFQFLLATGGTLEKHYVWVPYVAQDARCRGAARHVVARVLKIR